MEDDYMDAMEDEPLEGSSSSTGCYVPYSFFACRHILTTAAGISMETTNLSRLIVPMKPERADAASHPKRGVKASTRHIMPSLSLSFSLFFLLLLSFLLSHAATTLFIV